MSSIANQTNKLEPEIVEKKTIQVLNSYTFSPQAADYFDVYEAVDDCYVVISDITASGNNGTPQNNFYIGEDLIGQYNHSNYGLGTALAVNPLTINPALKHSIEYIAPRYASSGTYYLGVKMFLKKGEKLRDYIKSGSNGNNTVNVSVDIYILK